MNTSRKKITAKTEGNSKNTFSVITYNILADYHVKKWKQNCYPFVKEDNLLKTDGLTSKRHLLTMKELDHFNCDVMLLQEVDTWYSALLEIELQKSGYEYKFFQKVGHLEGSSLCYKKDRFQCLEVINFSTYDEVKKICEVEAVPEDLINQKDLSKTIALIAVLKDIKTGKFIICAGTHLRWNCADPSIQALQACLICQKLHKVRDDMSASLSVDQSEICIIFGGDFNGEPDAMCIKLMKKGKLSNAEIKTLETLIYTVTETKAVPTTSTDISMVSKYLSKYLENPLKLSSAFCDVTGNEPVITAVGFNPSYEGCLDYIFYTSDLEVASVVDIDSAVAEIYAHGGPTEQFASDHLPLIAEFIF